VAEGEAEAEEVGAADGYAVRSEAVCELVSSEVISAPAGAVRAGGSDGPTSGWPGSSAVTNANVATADISAVVSAHAGASRATSTTRIHARIRPSRRSHRSTANAHRSKANANNSAAVANTVPSLKFCNTLQPTTALSSARRVKAAAIRNHFLLLRGSVPPGVGRAGAARAAVVALSAEEILYLPSRSPPRKTLVYAVSRTLTAPSASR
jgi:hypothetical protein